MVPGVLRGCRESALEHVFDSKHRRVHYLPTSVLLQRRRGSSPCTVGGFWCPVGSTSPTSTACLAGTYCPEGGSSTGVPLVCPLGYYCTEATAVPALCDFAGYLCPAGSSSPTGTQCNAGRFGTSAGASIFDSGDCEGPCTGAAGRYCPKGSPDTDGMLCSDGSYCTGGSAVSDGGAGFCLCATAVINFVLAMHL
jgi:hypothetical protein